MVNPQFMTEALSLAKDAFLQDEIPVGALIVCNNQILAKAFNTRETSKNPLQHAEILVLQEAAQKKGDWRLSDCDLYVTLEPCPMCLGALFQARIRSLVFGAFDQKRDDKNFLPSLKYQISDFEKPISLAVNNHNLKIYGGVCEKECSQILKEFFQKKRKQ